MLTRYRHLIAATRGLLAASRQLQSDRRSLIVAFIATTFLGVSPAQAHPHVFVDGGIDFRFANGTQLEAIEVTWIYDEFETLYILSSYGLKLNAQGKLDEQDRLELIRYRSEWPSDFDGSVHIDFAGERIALEWPSDLDADLVDGRLRVTFLRALSSPINLDNRGIEVAFYESTYFFAFSITQNPQILDGSPTCMTDVTHFDPDEQDSALLAALAKLGREETTDIANVGASFADRITLECS